MLVYGRPLSKRAIGRRVLHSYLMLFLHSYPEINESFDYDQLAQKALNTYTLGEFVGPKLGLPSVMKWRPVGLDEKFDVRDALRLGRDVSRSIGLYKVSGTTVEAVVGGVFHQFVSLCQLLLRFRVPPM